MSPPRRAGPGEGSWPEHARRRPGSGPWRPGGRRAFGATWWGRAWVDALEQRARLDPNRLPRGRTYARTGAVDGLEVAPGSVSAAVQGSRRRPYAVSVRVRAFTDAEWGRVLDSLSAQIGHVAALLDGELPAEVADDVGAAGLDLLPGAGEVQPRCTCPDWADPCKHSAAVCYLVADEIDRDPFQLLLLRGRRREELLGALRARRSGGAKVGHRSGTASPGTASPGTAEPATGDTGVPARAAWDRTPDAPPSVPLPPRRAGRPTVLAIDPPPDSGLTAATLALLAGDAARRALDLAVGRTVSVGEPDADTDLVRRAAATLPSGPDRWGSEPAGADVGASLAPSGAPGVAELARAAGHRPKTLFLRALAWQQGGTVGLAVLDGSWDPSRSETAGGRALLGAGASVRRNRVTLGDRQLRLGTDGAWYPYRRVRGTWEPDGQPMDAEGVTAGDEDEQ